MSGTGKLTNALPRVGPALLEDSMTISANLNEASDRPESATAMKITTCPRPEGDLLPANGIAVNEAVTVHALLQPHLRKVNGK